MTSNEFTAPPLVTILAHVPASFLVPNIIDPFSGIDSKYWIKNGDGTPNLKPIKTGKLIQFSIVNSIGESMLAFRTGNVMKQFWQDTAALVSIENTAGFEFPAGNDQFYGFSTRYFRFNDSIEITGSIVAKGFPVTLPHNTLSVSDNPAFLPSNILRDLTDPQMEPFEYENFYDKDALDFAYINEISFEWQGARLNFSIDGGANFQSSISLAISEIGQVVSVHQYTFDFIGQGVGEGDIITLVSELLTIKTEFGFDGSVDGYDANVTSRTELFYKEETECASDGVENVSDDEDDCIEAGDAPPSNVCTPNFCGGDPSMQVSVSGASGTINWLGETWNLPADSGVKKCVCPTNYTKGQYPIFTTEQANNIWDYKVGLDYHLRLKRLHYLNSTSDYAINSLIFDVGALSNDFKHWVGGTVVNSNFDLNLISAVGQPTNSDYIITDDFFGMHTISGITYEWERGEDWP
jgi:hypothetical protein